MNKICFRAIVLLIGLVCMTAAYALVNYTKTYYPAVNAAEIDITEKAYGDALSKYRTAFASVNHPISVDLVNAAVCASMIDSTDLAYSILLQLASIGIDVEYLDTFSGFKKIRDNQHWNAFIAQYGKAHSAIQFDDETRILLDSMHVWDQRFRILPGSYAVYGDTIKLIDSQNIQLMLELVESKGFPSERMIGRQIPGISMPGYIVFLHHCQVRSKDENSALFNFQDMFADAVSYGEADPYIAASYLSMQGKFAPGLGPTSIWQLSLNEMPSMLYREKPYRDYSDPIDQKRLQFGMDTIENFYRKALFFHTDLTAVYFNFRRYGMLDVLFVDQTMYDQLSNVFEPLIK